MGNIKVRYESAFRAATIDYVFNYFSNNQYSREGAATN